MKNNYSKTHAKKVNALYQEFKKFITRGNVLDMAVGVIMGSAFGAIVNALVKILLSVCTWGVPGGINGLITVLPAINEMQVGLVGIGQSFAAGNITDVAKIYAISQGFDATSDVVVQNAIESIKNLYTLHGTNYYFNQSAIIDWGTLITAAINFLIIAFVLFSILKIFTYLQKKRETLKKKEEELYYSKHPEERPAPVEPGKPAPTEIELLTQIRDTLKTQKEEK